MLLELSIENFVLIKKINISFFKGLNVMTGETGAGKSIILDAINLALGGKSSREYVRRGKEKAVIQAVFDISNVDIKNILDEYGIDYEDDILILAREVYGTGRSVSRINGRIAQLSFVNKISKYLIDIHGQHEHQSLLYPDNHLSMLDLYGNDKLANIKDKVEKKYKEIKELQDQLRIIGNIDEQERERKIDLLKFQINEINSCNLKVNEDNELEIKYEKLKNIENIYKTINEGYEMISEGINNEYSLSSILANLVSRFESLSSFDKKLYEFHNEFQDIYYRIQDLATDMRRYGEDITFEDNEVFEIENRLNVINSLKRKYGNSIEEILEYRDKLEIELKELEDSSNKIEQINLKIQENKDKYLNLSNELSLFRKKIAKDFEKKMLMQLKDLNLEKANFKVKIDPKLNKNGEFIITKHGIDDIEFLISTNPGEPLKKLSKVASGGEISRIMLAMKTVFAEIDNIPTLIFDEIDTGISGKTANIVGEKLAVVSNTHQTICITHLPQIAVMADNHLFIEKIIFDDETVTNINKLTEDERVKEISRLIGGNTITNLTIKNAKEMIELASKTKNKLIS